MSSRSSIVGFAAGCLAFATPFTGCAPSASGSSSTGSSKSSSSGSKKGTTGGSSSGSESGSSGSSCASGLALSDGGCGPGCQETSNCSIGQCTSDDNCSPCAIDSECTSGLACQSGTCSLPCSDSNPCSGTGSCCSGDCVDLSQDLSNCGACASACSPTEACGATGCVAIGFNEACQNPALTVILDGLPIDDDAGMSIGNALFLKCQGSSMLSSALQSSGSGIVDPTTGAPLVGDGNLLVTTGGPDVQSLVSFLENQTSPVYFSAPGEGASQQYSFIERASGSAVISAPVTSVGATHDYFVIELVRAPTSGVVTIICYGFTDYGTQAGSWYWNTQMLPTVDASTPLWTIMEWTAGQGRYDPSQFSTVASGE
jgi:hypothetical protein